MLGPVGSPTPQCSGLYHHISISSLQLVGVGCSPQSPHMNVSRGELDRSGIRSGPMSWVDDFCNEVMVVEMASTSPTTVKSGSSVNWNWANVGSSSMRLLLGCTGGSDKTPSSVDPPHTDSAPCSLGELAQPANHL